MAEAIEPVRREIEVAVSPARAFAVFAAEMAAWWPLGSHSMPAQEENRPALSIELPPHAGGLIKEVAASGRCYPWWRVKVCQPGERLVQKNPVRSCRWFPPALPPLFRSC